MLLHLQTNGKCWVGGHSEAGVKYSPSIEQSQGFWKWLKIFLTSTMRWLKHNTCWRSPRSCFKRSTFRATVIFFSLWTMLPPFHILNQSPWHSAEARQGVRQQHLWQSPHNRFCFPDRHIISTWHRGLTGALTCGRTRTKPPESPALQMWPSPPSSQIPLIVMCSYLCMALWGTKS